MFISGHVTLGNGSCNLCRNKIARQGARKIAQCNSAFTPTPDFLQYLSVNTDHHLNSPSVSLTDQT